MAEQKRISLFANRDFRLLFMGSTISILGDQFTLLALPWLVLKLTGDPQQLGLVTAVMALPMAVFMLIGGDRKSTRLNSSHVEISYAVFCLKKKTYKRAQQNPRVSSTRSTSSV